HCDTPGNSGPGTAGPAARSSASAGPAAIPPQKQPAKNSEEKERFATWCLAIEEELAAGKNGPEEVFKHLLPGRGPVLGRLCHQRFELVQLAGARLPAEREQEHP